MPLWTPLVLLICAVLLRRVLDLRAGGRKSLNGPLRNRESEWTVRRSICNVPFDNRLEFRGLMRSFM